MSSSESELSDWPSEDEAQPLVKPKFKSKEDEVEWERKQRNREYRVAARREKRTRKADEKKQRKLNATILRRMTKNPEKYNKNVDRNRRRDIQQERYTIWREAVAQAERLAAIHDPSGKIFNIGPVVVQEDGKVISVETLNRRAKAQAEKAAKAEAEKAQAENPSNDDEPKEVKNDPGSNGANFVDGVNPARQPLIDAPGYGQPGNGTSGYGAPTPKRMSKTQQRKLAMLEDRPAPPKPIIPEGISIPEGEENWLSLWDATDAELERRVLREKKRKAAERKALRQKQKEGKKERRAARDERRKVYREKKEEWKAIKAEEKRHKRQLERVEQEEAKKIEVEVNLIERQRAMEACAKLGFTLENVEGVADIKPRALGMKGREVDFSILEVGDRPSELKIKGAKENQQSRSGRVDLGLVTDESRAKLMAFDEDGPTGLDNDFVSFDNMNGQEIGASEFNHKLRRKLRRAIEAAQIKKENLVRQKAVEHCQSKGIEVPQELATEYQAIKLSNRRLLEDGTVETEKHERGRKRIELAEYNKAAKVLRKQAKAEAIEAGLRTFASLTGLPTGEVTQDQEFTGETLPGIKIVSEQDVPTIESSKKRRNSDDLEDRKPKKSKHSKESAELPNGNQDGIEADASSEVKKVKKSKKTKGDQDGTEADASSEVKKMKKSKKRNDDQDSIEADANSEVKKVKKSKREDGKVSKKTEESRSLGTAQQWNPDALSGGAARKDKFLRLLGASKANGVDDAKSRKSTSAMNIAHVQDDLERQFESGMRMKHDGQGKRRGLGA